MNQLGKYGEWLVACCLAFAVTTETSAQVWDGIPSADYSQLPYGDPYDPPPPVERNEVHDYVDWSPLTGLFFRYDRIFFMMTPPPTSTVGDPGTSYLVPHDNGGTTTILPSLDTSWIDPVGGWGDRFEFGWRSGANTGWQVGVLNARQRQSFQSNGAVVVFRDPQALIVGFRDTNADGIDDDINGNNVYGSSGADTSAPPDGTIDVPAPADTGDLNLFLPQFTTFTQTSTTTLTGVDAMTTFSQPGFFGIGELDFFGGARYLRLRDDYLAVGTGGILDVSYWDATVDNHLVGPQIGMRWNHRYSFLSLLTEARGMSAYNRQHSRLAGQIASNHTTATRPTQLYANTFTSSFERDEFSPLAEWRTELVLEVIDGLSFRMGYTGMYIGGISRAAPKVDYVLPTIGLLSRDNATSFFANGLSLGLQLDF